MAPTPYAPTLAGLQSAVNDAAGYQDAVHTPTQCIPYIITIPVAASPIDFGGFDLLVPVKNCAQYVRIRSDHASDLPPEGTRINPSIHSAYMPQLVSNFGSGFGHNFIITAAGGRTQYWSFEGIEFYCNSGDATGTFGCNWIANIGETGSDHPTSVDPSWQPDHFEFHHVWMHGVPGTRNLAVGLGLAGNHHKVLDSYFDVIALDGGESKGIVSSYMSCCLVIRNNYINAATENTFIGGSFSPAGQLPAHIEWVGNQYAKQGYYKFGSGAGAPTSDCYKDNVWRNTTNNHDYYCDGANTWHDQGGLTTRGPDDVKNIWEVKQGRGYLVYGNDMSGTWVPGLQTAEAFVINLVTQSTTSDPLWVFPNTVGSQPWTTAESMLITGNHIHDGQAGMTLGYEQNASEAVCDVASPPSPCFAKGHNNITYVNNLHENMMSAQGYDFSGNPEGNGWLASVNQGDFTIRVAHNTYLVSTFSGTAVSGQMSRAAASTALSNYSDISFDNNIVPLALHGWDATGSPGSNGICDMLSGLYPNAPWSANGNLLTRDLAAWINSSFNPSSPYIATGNYSIGCSTSYSWPTGTQIPAANGGLVVDESAPTWKVIAPYQGTATDGTDPGANIDLVNWATADAIDGLYNPYLDFTIRSVQPTAGGAKVYYSALDATACTTTVSLSLTFSSPAGSSSISQTGRDGLATLSGLSNDTGYYLKITCGPKYITGEIITGH